MGAPQIKTHTVAKPPETYRAGATSPTAVEGDPTPSGAARLSEPGWGGIDAARRSIGQRRGPAKRVALPPAALSPSSKPSLPSYRFAERYTIDQIMTDPAAAASFARDYIAGEAPFMAVARHPESGLTYDGVNLDPKTGRMIGPRPHSAPSKECLDLGLLVKALRRTPGVAPLFGTQDPEAARAEAAAILSRKLAAYRAFNRAQPGYAGFLPWYLQPGGEVRPTPDWEAQIPGLDNGEWIWSMLVTEKVLRDEGFTELAQGYHEYNDMLRANVTRVFYDPEARLIRGDVRIVDPSSASTAYETHTHRAIHLTGEHGVHEGMMLLHFVTLFGDLPPGAEEHIWDNVTMKRVEHEHGTTWQGYWGSSHESWSYLFLPQRDLPEYRELFRLREIIRTQNAAARGYPGFGTSINEPGDHGDTGYLSAAGIEDIGTQPVPNNHVYAIYGAFPLLLEHAGQTAGNVGLAWLLNMLKGPRAQGPLGAGESVRNDGTKVSPTKTIDGTLPNLLAMFGGLEAEAAATMRELGVYDRFIERLRQEYDETFGDAPLRAPSDFALPTVATPHPPGTEYVAPPSTAP